jgi:nicotinamidase-related amidase
MSDLELDPRRMAIVVIDLQKGILRMPSNPHPTAVVVNNCATLRARARQSSGNPLEAD